MLEGIRVLDFTHTLAGLYCAMHLTDFGAEVIQIEPSKKGIKGVGSRSPSGWQADGFDMRFLMLCRNKNSMVLNLKEPGARDVFHDLVKKADVVVDNFRPEATKRLGIDYETLKEVNPEIISCSITGFNRNGPYRDLPGFDYVIEALSGFWSLTGEPGKPPMVPAIPILDVTTGMFAAKGILAALYHRAVHGVGQKVDVSLLSTAVALTLYDGVTYLNSGAVPAPQGMKLRSVPLFGAFQTKNSYIGLCVGSDQQYMSLCKVLNADHLVHDPRFDSREKRVENYKKLDDLVQDILLEWDTAPLIEALSEADVPAAEVVNLGRAFADPRVLKEDIIGTVDWKDRTFKIIKSPIRMSTKKDRPQNAPPDLGNKTDEIVSKLLGYSGEKINRLKEKGIIGLKTRP